ncbi:hypothetical protein DM01DRAFT_1333320 [Hesseltinella vesiculosa]|uniref:Uncharacterized protein n=1 Tax=Hesseltinella vesiculosa TaxID=101127 RepID=A0A1X2GPN7_9FUNG|nr:hypothetical protein DM01DRAFT_1333320 [Hesseltinella vesiculosa]
MTDIRHLEPVKDEPVTPPTYGKDWKQASIFAVEDKHEDQAVVVVLTKGRTPSPAPELPIVPDQPSPKDQLRNALRGAFDLVEEKILAEDTVRPSSSNYNKDLYLSWPDVILTESLHVGTFDQDLWDDEAQILGPPSPAYHAINDNPILDSSLPSRISSIMPLSSIQPPAVTMPVTSLPPSPLHTSTPITPSSTSAPHVTQQEAPSPTTQTTPSKRWNVWHKMKQVAQPLKRSIKPKSVFKRLFQH